MPLSISLVDYGAGNLHSIKKALEYCGAEVSVVRDMKSVSDSSCIVFPGVGAFDSTMGRLRQFRESITERLSDGIPALGICIGMQILFESSEEGSFEGLGLFKGHVVRLESPRVPHMGWNGVSSSDPLLDGAGNCYYFAHSYRGKPDEDGITAGMSEYDGEKFPSVFRKKNVYGTQFHPEKSSTAGLRVLKNFISFAEECQ